MENFYKKPKIVKTKPQEDFFVDLDTVDEDEVGSSNNKRFLDFLKKNNIKTQNVMQKGPEGEWPVVKYSGAKPILEKMMMKYFDEGGLDDPQSLAEFLSQIKKR